MGNVPTRAFAALERVFGTLPAAGFDLVARVSLLYVLFHPFGERWARASVTALAAWGVLSGSMARRPLIWVGIIVVTATQVSWRSDNHMYLFIYWMLTLALATALDDAERIARLNAKWLIGLAFAFASLWKAVLSADYMDGTFFHGQLFFDRRFQDFATVAGGLTPELANTNRFLLREITSELVLQPAMLKTTTSLWTLAILLTWWTVVIETIVAVAFLLPASLRLSRSRDWILLLFVTTTYAVAPVAGFGWLLLVMGLAQSDQRNVFLRAAYLGCLVLVLAYKTVSISGFIQESLDADSDVTTPQGATTAVAPVDPLQSQPPSQPNNN